MSVRISVAICTHNRSFYLKKALLSLTQQTVPADVFEVLVVDNASTDDTRSLVASFPNVRYVYEGKLGLSNARNRALDAATGEFIAYLDDDAVASPVWLQSLLDTFDSAHVAVGCVGGRIDPIWETPRPAWLPEELTKYFTVLDRGPVRKQLNVMKETVFGANMAFLRSALQAVGAFDPSLGRVGNRLLSCEETLVQRWLAAKGYATYYDPHASVSHHIIRSRVTPDWLAQRAFWQGVSEAAMSIRLTAMKPMTRVLRVVPNVIRLLIDPFRRMTQIARHPQEAQKLLLRCRRMSLLGYVYGYLAFRR